MNIITKQTDKKPIDIIVPIHGRFDLTVKCVRALYDNTSSPFKLIVLDDTPEDKDNPDAMSPEYFRRLSKHKDNLLYIHHDKPYKEGNEFFNEGLKHCHHDFVAVVMNSVTVQPDWELVAIQLMNSNPKIGIIGLKTLLPSGVIESAGITMMGFTPLDIGRDSPGYALNNVHGCIAVQWAFALLRKQAVKGNMEEGIYNGFAGWDDVDNSFNVRSKGWEIFYCGSGVGIHEPRSTRGKDTIDSVEKNRQNAETFFKRWGYWEKYQAASKADNIHMKSKIAEEVQGLAFSLRSNKEEREKLLL